MSGLVAQIRLRRVRYADLVALRDVDLDVAAGEIIGVVGHVGAGKTTLALAAAGLIGRAMPGTIDGSVTHPAGGDPPAAYVFANPWTQLTELGGTVEEEVAVGPENQALASEVIRARVDDALRRADAAHLAARLPQELSGGELQRVALASALALDAPLLVLDEPTAQLDPESARAFANALRGLSGTGKGIILVEQNLALVRELATRLIVLGDGAVIADGSPEQLLDRWPPVDARLGAPPDIERAHEATSLRQPANGTPLLEISGLSAGYHDRDVLNGLSLSISTGSAVAWVGRNGAGKSTLAKTIMGLVPQRAGAIRVAGTSLETMLPEQRARFVGLVFQDPSRQLFSRTVIDEVMFGPRALGMRAVDARAGAIESLELVGLAAALHTHPGDLTPQAQRRLAIAAAMASRPPLLILDEPTAGQDAEGRGFIARALTAQRARGAAAVITHDLHFASRECDAVQSVGSAE